MNVYHFKNDRLTEKLAYTLCLKKVAYTTNCQL